MYRMIAIPVMVLFMFLVYFFFEVPILKMMAWATGDGLVNSYVIYRLEENNELEAIQELTRANHPKARLFSLHVAHKKNLEQGLTAIPLQVADESWEVRMQAIKIAKARKYKPAGKVVTARILSGDPLGEEATRWGFEKEALLDALAAVAAPDNAESLAQMAISTTNRDMANKARKALWPLGPLPQAERAYSEILRSPKDYRPDQDDLSAVLRAAGALGLPQALEQLIYFARSGGGRNQADAIKAMGDLGGEQAKVFLKSVAEAPEWKLQTAHAQNKQRLAVRALERIRLKEAGEADIADEPEAPVTAEDAKASSDEPSVDDLLASYSSEATTTP